MIALLGVLLSGLGLCACASQDSATPAPTHIIHYVCADGTKPVVNFGVEIASMTLTLDRKDHTLKLEQTASGARYVGDGISFWMKGSNAMLERKGKPSTNCHVGV